MFTPSNITNKDVHVGGFPTGITPACCSILKELSTLIGFPQTLVLADIATAPLEIFLSKIKV